MYLELSRCSFVGSPSLPMIIKHGKSRFVSVINHVTGGAGTRDVCAGTRDLARESEMCAPARIG